MRWHHLLPPLLAILLSLCGCGSDKDFRVERGSVWTTGYSAIYRSDKSLGDSILNEIHIVDESLSAFNDSSLVSRINRGENTVIDESFRYIFELSRQVSILSGGQFDPTLGRVVDAYGFGSSLNPPLPSQAEIDSLMNGVGISHCKISPSGRVIRKSEATAFDFSSVAKGYAVDRIAEMLRRNMVTDYLVEIGGEIAVGGHNSDGAPWNIMIEYPSDSDILPGERGIAVLRLSDKAVATSGNYRRYHDSPEGRIGHIIDASTGLPVRGSTLQATVVAPSCALADALATACMIMPPEKALLMVTEITGAEALLVSVGSSDTLKVSFTPGFKNLL